MIQQNPLSADDVVWTNGMMGLYIVAIGDFYGFNPESLFYRAGQETQTWF